MTRLGEISLTSHNSNSVERFSCPPENLSYREYTVNPIDLQYRLFLVSFFLQFSQFCGTVVISFVVVFWSLGKVKLSFISFKL